MTKEEAIVRIKKHKITHQMNESRAIYISEALDMAIEVLEKQSCGEDCISREAMLLLQAKYAQDMGATKFWRMRDDIRSLPSIAPEPKMAHWIRTRAYHKGFYEDIDYVECSYCHEYSLEEGNYCPNCGARMEVEND